MLPGSTGSGIMLVRESLGSNDNLLLEVVLQSSADQEFAHRPSPDGSVDSICLYCFRTIALGQSPAALERSEAQHSCPSKRAGEGNPLKPQRNNG